MIRSLRTAVSKYRQALIAHRDLTNRLKDENTRADGSVCPVLMWDTDSRVKVERSDAKIRGMALLLGLTKKEEEKFDRDAGISIPEVR